MMDLPTRDSLEVRRLGEADLPSPLRNTDLMVDEDDRVVVTSSTRRLQAFLDRGVRPPSFERAGAWNAVGLVKLMGRHAGFRPDSRRPHAEFCLQLGQHAVHAGMAGRTDMVVGYWNRRFTHVPIPVATAKPACLDPDGPTWQRVLEATGQPSSMVGR